MKYVPVMPWVRSAGRNLVRDNVLYLGQSGTYVEFETSADEVEIVFVSDRTEGHPESLARAAVTVNGERRFSEKYQTETAVLCCDVRLGAGETKIRAELGTPGEEKTVRVVKLSEDALGLLGIVSLEVPADESIVPTKKPAAKVEIIGDSITCGFGNEGKIDVDVFTTATENALDAYSVRLAEMLGMDYELVSWSGIGVLSQYVPPQSAAPRHEILMGDYYLCQAARSEERINGEYPVWKKLSVFDKGLPAVNVSGKEQHDFSELPALIVIALGSNDASYTESDPQRTKVFYEAYSDFLDEVAERNPGVPILCALGTVNPLLAGTERKAVAAASLRHTDRKMAFVELPQQEPVDLGVLSHPNKKTHCAIAARLCEEARRLLYQ